MVSSIGAFSAPRHSVPSTTMPTVVPVVPTMVEGLTAKPAARHSKSVGDLDIPASPQLAGIVEGRLVKAAIGDDR